jgi:ABC-type sugar transport system ATPase subunit
MSAGGTEGAPALQVVDVSKRYGKTLALASLSLSAPAGRITGIAGPNGAGKSTLVQVLAGEVSSSGGTVTVDGLERTQADLARLTAVVHQEPQLFPTMTVGENLMVGREGSAPRRPHLAPSDVDLLSDLGILRHLHTWVGELPIAAQQRTEIARALALDARIFLFDEPNSALTEAQSSELFDQMRALADRQRVVLFVSHRLQELATVSDAVAVIKDGRVTAWIEGDRLTEGAVARELAGSGPVARDREHSAASAGRPGAGAPERGPLGDGGGLAVTGWTHPKGAFDAGSVTVGVGEVLAVLGVEGSGAREFTASLAGFVPTVGTAQMRWDSRPTAPERSTGYVPASRQDSVFGRLSVAECLVARLPVARVTGPGGILSLRRVRADADRLIQDFGIRCSGPDQVVGELSGGNQQKVVIASAIAPQPDVLVVEEPTRGVDLRSRGEIYRLLRRFAADGRSVVLYCTEVAEAFEAADTCLVFSRGAIVGRVRVADVPDLTGLVDAIAGLEALVPSGGRAMT